MQLLYILTIYLHKKYYRYINIINIYCSAGFSERGHFWWQKCLKTTTCTLFANHLYALRNKRIRLTPFILCSGYAPHTGGITHYRSNKSRLVVVSQTMIAHFVKVVIQARAVVLRRAKRFLSVRTKTHITALAVLCRHQAVFCLCVFFFSVHFSFCVAIKKKSEHNKNILARYSDNIFYVPAVMTCSRKIIYDYSKLFIP